METIVSSIPQEMSAYANHPITTRKSKQDWLLQLQRKASHIPNGFIKKITWDQEGGYPEHAWGFVQYTVRPYVPGYGCDGTTDENIHLIASVLAERSGIDYVAAYRKAYKDEPDWGIAGWHARLRKNTALLRETVIPESCTRNDWILGLGDLYDINNRSLVAELEKQLMSRFPRINLWHETYQALRQIN